MLDTVADVSMNMLLIAPVYEERFALFFQVVFYLYVSLGATDF